MRRHPLSQSVDMVFLQPEKSVCDKEVTYFAPTEVEDQRAPIAVFTLPRIGMFVKARSVELSQSKVVLREMARNPVHNDSDALLVATIDEMTKLVRVPKAARWRIVTGDLVTPGTVKRMLGDGQQFDMGVAHFFDIRDQSIRELEVTQISVILLGKSRPRPKMNLINTNG